MESYNMWGTGMFWAKEGRQSATSDTGSQGWEPGASEEVTAMIQARGDAGLGQGGGKAMGVERSDRILDTS